MLKAWIVGRGDIELNCAQRKGLGVMETFETFEKTGVQLGGTPIGHACSKSHSVSPNQNPDQTFNTTSTQTNTST